MKLIFLVLAIALILPFFRSTAEAETRYDSFVYDDRIKSSLFLTGEIRQGDSLSCVRRCAIMKKSPLSSWVRLVGTSTKGCKWGRFCGIRVYRLMFLSV